MSADEGVNGEDVAIVGPSTTHGYDPETGTIRIMPYARKTWNPQFFKAMAVSAGNTSPVLTPSSYDVRNYDKLRLVVKTSGAGNLEVLIRISLDGGFTFHVANTLTLGDMSTVKTMVLPIETIGAPLLSVGINNKAGNIQSVDVWGFLW